MSSENKKPLLTFKDFIAGGAAGMAQLLSGQPFDIVKVRLQTTGGNALEIVKKIFKKDGIQGFYKGTLSPLIFYTFCISNQFAGFNFSKRMIAKLKYNGDDLKLSIPDLMLAGWCAAFFYTFILSPMELGRIKMQVKSDKGGPIYKSSIHAIFQIAKAQGFRGLYFGYFSTFLRESFGGMIYFGIYEGGIKTSLPKHNNDRKQIPKWKVCWYGGLAGFTLWTILFPIDIIKSRMQGSDFNNTPYKSISKTGQIIFKEQGIKGLYTGLFPCQIRAFIANAIGFMAYEFANDKLNKKGKNKI